LISLTATFFTLKLSGERKKTEGVRGGGENEEGEGAAAVGLKRRV
jgi:hypothetical protein